MAFFAIAICLFPLAAAASATTAPVLLTVDSQACGRILPSKEWSMIGHSENADEVRIRFKPRRSSPLSIVVKCVIDSVPLDMVAMAGLIKDDSGEYYMRNFGFHSLNRLWHQSEIPPAFAKALGDDVVLLRPEAIRGEDWFFVVECGTECFLSATLDPKNGHDKRLRAHVVWPLTKTFDRAARLKPSLQRFVAHHLMVDTAAH